MARINLTLPQSDLDAIDAFLESQPDLPVTTRSAFLRYCALKYIRDWRISQGPALFI